MRPLIQSISKGQDIVILARTKLLESQSKDVEVALSQVIKRSGLDNK
jgi:RNase P protein component